MTEQGELLGELVTQEPEPMYELTEQQIRRSLTPVRSDRIEKIQGNDYIPQHEVRAELIRQFGPGGWDSQVVELHCLWDELVDDGPKGMRWHVGYRAGVRLRVRDLQGRPVAEFVEYHFDEKVGPSRNDCHGNAITSAASYALRRAAIGLGDNYGLCLYTGAGPVKLVQGTLALPPTSNAPVQTVEPKGEDAPTDEEAAQRLTQALGARPVDGQPVLDRPMSEASETMDGSA